METVRPDRKPPAPRPNPPPPALAQRPHPAPARSLDEPLVQLSEADFLTHRNLLESVMVFGSSGAGKSSGPGEHLAKALLRHGYGVLVLCAKKGEADDWARRAARAGRERDVVRLGPGQPHTCNLLDYSLAMPGTRGGGLVTNTVDMLMRLLELKFRGGGGGDAQFFTSSAGKWMTLALTALHAAREPIGFDALAGFIASAPLHPDEPADPEFRAKSPCNRVIEAAAARTDLSAVQQHDLRVAIDFWLREFPAMDDRTRSNILATVQSVLWPFQVGLVGELFGRGATTAPPHRVFDGTILVVDLPVKEFHEAGQFAQVCVKLLFQRAVEAREVATSPRLVALYADEVQTFLTSTDVPYLATSRSAGVANVWLTQSVSGIKSALPAASAEAEAGSLLANFSTVVFCQNNNRETNQFAADLIGQRWETVANTTAALASESMSSSTADRRQYVVEPREFTLLQKGGPPGNAVGSIVYRGGSAGADGRTHLRVFFPQK